MTTFNKPRHSGVSKGCLFGAVCIVGVVILLIFLGPVLSKRYRAATLVAKIKADNTGCIPRVDPELLEFLVQDVQCKQKITEVWVAGDYGPKLSDKRYRLLKQLPCLRIIRIEYSDPESVDAFLEYIQGMESLEELTLHSAMVSEKGIKYLKTFARLRTLDLTFNRVTDRDLKELQRALPNCKILGHPSG